MPLPSPARIILFMTAAVLLGLAQTAAAQPTPRRALLALSKDDHTLAIVDPATLKIVAKAPIGPAPHEVIASTDGKTAYLSNYRGDGYPLISVVDLVSQKALPPIHTGALTETHGLAFVGGELWFTAQGSKAVARYNPATGNIDWVMGTGQSRTHMIYVTPDENHVYTTNPGSGSVTFMDKVTTPAPGGQPGIVDWTETQVRVGRGDEGFDISPDGRELWTADAQDGTLSVIDLQTRQVTNTIDAHIVGSNRLKFTPDGKYVLISNLRGPNLVIYNAATRKEVKQIPIGHGAAGILMDPVAHRAFIACSPDNYIVVLDLAAFTVTGHLDVGGQPDGMAWAIRP